MIILLALIPLSALAQITDASFFPSVRSINPGVVHMRRGGLVSLDHGKKSTEKVHHVNMGGFEPINTNVDLSKTTFFGTYATRLVSGELLFDMEKGERQQKIRHPTRGNRTTTDEATSNYIGGMLDFRFFGVSYARSGFDFTNQFRAGEPPLLSAHDEKQELTYRNFKVGSAIKIGVIRVGAYFLQQKAEGDYTYTFYDPTSGAQGTSESFPVTKSTTGFGAGLGFNIPKMRSEVSYESMSAHKLDVSDDYPSDIIKTTASSRITAIGEIRLSFISLGIRFRSIRGNYVDLEDVISTNLLYDTMGENDVRTETSFNFSFGDSNGFSPSLYYTQSEVTSNEKEPILNSGEKFKAVTKSKAYGANLTYRF